MSSNREQADNSWTLFADLQFEDFEEFSEMVRTWDLDFRQLCPGPSPTELLQFGSPDLLVMRFSFSQPYHQMGSSPPNMLTFALIEQSDGDVVTPEGVVNEKGLWCLSASGEFTCASQSKFRGCTLSLAESLLDEVAELYEMPNALSAIGPEQIIRCREQANLDRIRGQLDRVFRNIRHDGSALHSPLRARELEFDLARQILEALEGPRDASRPTMSNRKRLVLRRAMDYVEANQYSPITVYELAQAAGASVRTLEYAFKDHFGVSPKAYLTTRRLIGARRQLIISDAVSTRVNDVAYGWGFQHMSQFSGNYQRFFGELPSETLQNGRPRKQ